MNVTAPQAKKLGKLLIDSGRGLQAVAVLAGVCKAIEMDSVTWTGLMTHQATMMIRWLVEDLREKRKKQDA